VGKGEKWGQCRRVWGSLPTIWMGAIVLIVGGVCVVIGKVEVRWDVVLLGTNRKSHGQNSGSLEKF